MNRYSKITNKNCREIVLLKSFPCAWGKCTFCDYIEDNSTNEAEMNQTNIKVLEQITGEFSVLEVINSASCFELPKGTLEKIKEVIHKKGIKKLYFESHWMYRHKLKEMEEFMGLPILYKIGIETFEPDFRETILNKHAGFQTPDEVARYFQSPCLMVGIQGQTKEMIEQDIEILLQYFQLGTINIFTNNTTQIKRDEELVQWFSSKYHYLEENPNIEILYHNVDFGVGD